MSDKVDVAIVMNNAGVQSILKGEAVQELIQSYCETVRNNAGGDGYETSYVVGKYRYVGEVEAATYKTRRDNSKNNTLLKALRK